MSVNYTQLSPAALKGLFDMGAAIRQSGLEASLVDLIKIRASQMNGCLFCTDMHAKEARLHDVRELKLHHLPFWRESELFSPREKSALEWTERLTRFPEGGVEEASLEKLHLQFSDQEVSDLTLAIANINAWNRLGVAFKTKPGSLDQAMGLDRAGMN